MCLHRNTTNQSRHDCKPYLLFDAGGTLVFPDQTFLIQQARKHGIVLTHEQLFSGYYQVIYRLDCRFRNENDFPDDSWPENYAYTLFEALGLVTPSTRAVAKAFKARHRCKNLWAFTFDWVRETLSILYAQGYRMSVLSNSDGRTAKVFDDLGLTHYFEYIFDSQRLGIEKPDPAIFEWALRELNLATSDALYIGDVFEVDVRGANQAGLGALHLDPLGLYTDWPGVRIADISDLPRWLAGYIAHPRLFDLFPIRSLDHAPMSTSETQKLFAPSQFSGSKPAAVEFNDTRPFKPDSPKCVSKEPVQELGVGAQGFLGTSTTSPRLFGQKNAS